MFKVLSKIQNALRPEINRTDLLTLLRGMSADNFPKKRIESFRGLMYWMRLPVKVREDQIESDKMSRFIARNIRYKFLIQFLERNPDEADHFLSLIRDFTGRGKAIRLFCLTGVSENNYFFSELRERLALKIFPLAFGENDLAEIVISVFTEEEDALWIEECQDIIVPPLLKLIGEGSMRSELFSQDLQDAMIILTSQISSIGTSREIRRRSTNSNIAESPFIKLGKSILHAEEDDKIILNEISQCRQLLKEIKLSLEVSGVSVNLIYQLEKLSSLLDRLEFIIFIRDFEDIPDRNKLISNFTASLIRDEIRRTGIREFLKENLQMVTKKIVERAGEKGDYYIANTAQEKNILLKAGSWAGVLTAIAALFKSVIGQLDLPYLIEGMFFFLNYSIAFLLMQKWHLALSSKLPAYTASALSNKFEDFLKTKDMSELIKEIKKISRSQYISAVGNLIWVVPVCIALDWLLFLSTGNHLFSELEANQMIEKHGIFSSGTLFYAFLTGIFLWLSSIITGAVENWLIFRNFPKMIQESLVLNRLFKKESIRKFSSHAASTLGSIAGNLAISAMLAFPIIFGKVTGLPLDIRHVTLSAGTISFAFNALNWDITLWPQMLSMFFSILIMGVLNFGVSFYCSLKLAAIARNVDPKYLSIIFRHVLIKKK